MLGRDEDALPKLISKSADEDIVNQQQHAPTSPADQDALPNQNFQTRPDENQNPAASAKSRTPSLPPINAPTAIQHFHHDLESLNSIKSEVEAAQTSSHVGLDAKAD